MSKVEKDSLFVQEEEHASESENDYDQTHQEEDDDPIIDSIPFVINTVPARSSQSLHVIQYPGRPNTRPLNDQIYKAAIKEESSYLAVKLPLDTSKFFNTSRVEDWGETIGEQSLEGVLDDTEGGYYVGQVVQDGDSRKVVLVPVDSTAQLRPKFKYLDEIDQMAFNQRKAEIAEANKNTNYQMLQSSAKSSSQITNAEGFQNALGESLRHIKKFEEEPWAQLKWNSSEEETVENVKQSLRTGADGITLSTNTSFSQYIDELTRE